MAELRPGVRLGLDWGKARIGVAACDREGLLAYPVETVPAVDAARRLPQLVAEYEPVEIVLGLPVDLKGRRGIAAEYVLAEARRVAPLLGVPIRLSDERLSTASASRRLGQAGKNSRAQRQLIDQAAAVEILNGALEAERRGQLGELLIREGS
ncbi:MAG: Holliday junction resolvase RuvX [Propionibacteriaceae bacterium]|nr:Holliday junction resolvase RuvX [Propionibacteriaceae bacterium]